MENKRRSRGLGKNNKGTQRVSFSVSCQPEEREVIYKIAKERNISISKLVITSIMNEENICDEIYMRLLAYRDKYGKDPEVIEVTEDEYKKMLVEYRQYFKGKEVPEFIKGIPIKIK